MISDTIIDMILSILGNKANLNFVSRISNKSVAEVKNFSLK